MGWFCHKHTQHTTLYLYIGDAGTREFPIGLGGLKGDQDSDNKSYCQVDFKINIITVGQSSSI